MNEQVREAREVGLDILKPSDVELARGLELHRGSVVCDAYGFAPGAAPDGAALAAAMEAGASDAELQDVAEGMRMTRCVTDPDEREEFLDAWDAAGVTCIVQNAGEEGQSISRLIKRLARFTYVTDMLGDHVVRAVAPEDVVAAKATGRRALAFTGNGVPLAEQWVSVEEELRYIEVFFQLGIRMMHLTYNRRNMIGDGCAEPTNAGLSDFGRSVVAEMNRVGVIVDVAHSGQATSKDAALASRAPMVASHTVCADVNRHARGKSDDVIRAIVETGGYVGICWVPAFLGGAGDISSLLDHVDHVARTFGPDHVAIGTDVPYVSSRSAAEQAKMPARKRRARWANFWPPNDPLFDPKWKQPRQRLSLAWTNWPLLTVGLAQRGYSDDDVRKIIGGNVLRVAGDVRKGLDI